MAGRRTSQPSSGYTSSTSSLDSITISTTRRPSSTIMSSPTGSTPLSIQSPPSNTLPRVQLVPHVHRLNYDSSLSRTERDILDKTSFDAFDLSSKDFDFEDIFLYDRPQKKLSSVVEVSTPSREKDWSNFSFSHYASASTVRQKVNRNRTGAAEMRTRNQVNTQKR